MTLKTFSASEDELQLANKILLLTNCHEARALSPDAAIDIFKRSGLPYPVLRDIWAIADANGSGDLSMQELAAAIRLMGWVQAGETLNESVLAEFGPLPTLEGITDVQKPAVAPQPRFPPVNPDDVRHFKRTFTNNGPVGGFLDGDTVLEIYMTSNLSYGELWRIRKLVDTMERGALNFQEFAMGMYLVQAIQSCQLSSVPSEIPQEIFEQLANTDILDSNPASPRLAHSHRPTPSIHASSSKPRLSSPPKLEISPTIPPKIDIQEEYWDVTPLEKLESDKHFHKLDFERKGYIDGKTAANFMLGYSLPSSDLAHIWNLADLNSDDSLTRDEFAVAMHLIQRKMAGEDIPFNLPPSLIPPSMRSKVRSPPPILSPKPSIKSKPPPPPPRRDSIRAKRANGSRPLSTAKAISELSTPSRYSTSLSPPSPPDPSDSPPRSRRPSVSPFPVSLLSNISEKSVEPLSPFEDPSSYSLPPGRAASPLPPLPDNANNEALEEFKKETARLTLQVENLLDQLKAQNTLRDANEALRNEKDVLKAQVREMERTISEVLSAHDQNGSQEQYIQEIGRLTAELANKEIHSESTERMLAVMTEEDKELRTQLRESQAATTKSKAETDDLRTIIVAQNTQITELRARLTDMGKAMSEPASETDNRQLRVVFRDVTRENESLKAQVRDMQKSMEQMLLSTKFHAKQDELDRENRRLKAHVHELEMIATKLQSTSGNVHAAAKQSAESLTRENEQLKAQLKHGGRAFAEFRSTTETKLEELQQKLTTLSAENSRLKLDLDTATRRREDNSVPPPSYDDAFVIPPETAVA